MEHDVPLNASAVALSVFVGSAYERQNLSNLARLVDRGIEAGMPVLGVTAVGKELEKRDARHLALACRVTAELGAHFVKAYYCDGFEAVAAGCPVPLVIAGGLYRTARAPRDLEEAMQLIAAGRCDVDRLVTHRLPLSQVQKGFEVMLQGGDSLKVIIDPRLDA